jgi:hypothetical protein
VSLWPTDAALCATTRDYVRCCSLGMSLLLCPWHRIQLQQTLFVGGGLCCSAMCHRPLLYQMLFVGVESVAVLVAPTLIASDPFRWGWTPLQYCVPLSAIDSDAVRQRATQLQCCVLYPDISLSGLSSPIVPGDILWIVCNARWLLSDQSFGGLGARWLATCLASNVPILSQVVHLWRKDMVGTLPMLGTTGDDFWGSTLKCAAHRRVAWRQTSYYCRLDYDVRSPLMPGLAFLTYVSAKVANWREAVPIVPSTLLLTWANSSADKRTGRLQRDTSDL